MFLERLNSSEIEQNKLAEMKVESMKFHGELGESFDIDDPYSKNYSIEEALASLHDCHNYMIYNDDYVLVGFIQVSDYGYYMSGKTLEVNHLFIKSEHRHKGYAKRALDDIKLMFGADHLLLECWYGNSAELFYEKLGFKPIMKTYFL